MLPDMCVVVGIIHLMQAPIEYTRFLLADKSSQLPHPRATSNSRCCEMKLETVLSQFALYLRMDHQQQYNLGQRYVFFMVCGLFALERPLIFEMFETILNYLIILIEYYEVGN
nr:uncharacterized protein LOC106622170 [Bactrocera oleae]